MSLLTPKRIANLDYLDRAKFLLVWRLSVWFVVTLFIMCAVFIVLDDTKAIISYAFGLSFSSLGVVYLIITKKYKPIFIFYTLIGSIMVHIDLNMIHESHHFSNFLWMVILSMLAFYGLGVKWGIFLILFNAIASSYFILFNLQTHYEQVATASEASRYLLIVEIFFSMLFGAYLTWLSIKSQNIARSELEEANKFLEENNAIVKKRDQEKTILVKEIHHRVKNNLQIIISLLRLQMMDVKTEESKKHFSEAINRVMVMSSIHQKLYRQEEVTEFDLDTYIKELALELKSFFKEEFPIELEVNTNYKDIDLKTVVPLGLILNELLSNSLKYAFEQKESGKITVNIEDAGTFFTMTYSDDGIWKKSTTAMKGFGSELIEILTEQLNGTKIFKSTSEGTFYTFRLQKNIEDQ